MDNKFSNIYDPIEQDLDSRVFKGITPRPLIISYIKRKIFSTLRDSFVDDPERYFKLFLTGSLTTYQYSDASDCDISIFPDYDALEKITGEDDPIEIRKLLIAVVTTELDGTDLPGTPHPLQDFIQPPGLTPHDLFKPGERSGWDFQTRNWLVPPERERTHNVMSEMPDMFQKAQATAEKMTILLDLGDTEGAKDLYKQIHLQRTESEKAGEGDFGQANLNYKWLLHEGLFERLNNEAGMHIAKVSVAPILENPVTYQFVPFTSDELRKAALPSELYGTFYSQKKSLNKRAEKNNQSGRVSQQELAALFNRYNGSCAYCGQSGADSFDHVVPLWRGGSGDISNLLPCHDQCNHEMDQWDRSLDTSWRSGLDARDIPDAWTMEPAMAAAKEDSEKLKIIYDFANDSILLGDTTAKDKPKNDNLIIGEYDGKNAKLFDVAKQWVNANYFKRLWVNSFPTRPIEKIFFDKTEIPTRPQDQITYTQKLPHLTSAVDIKRMKEFAEKHKPEGGYGETLYNPDTKTVMWVPADWTENDEIDAAHKDFLSLEGVKKVEGEAEQGLPWKEKESPNQSLQLEESWIRIADQWRDGSHWKHFLKNRGEIVDFKIANDSIVEGKIVDFSDEGIKVEVKGGGTRDFDEDLLKDIKFKIRDDKHVLSAIFKNAVKVDSEYWQEQGLPSSGCFGFVNGQLMLADSHHQAIMGSLIHAGWTWEQLMLAEQSWGWFGIEGRDRDKSYLFLYFQSDSGFQNESAKRGAISAFATLYRLPVEMESGRGGVELPEEYGTGMSGQRPDPDYAADYLKGDVPQPPRKISSILKTSIKWEPDYWQDQKLPSGGCFGYVNGHLVLGKGHHQLIMARLIDAGWTWEELMEARQAWGWFELLPIRDFSQFNDYQKYQLFDTSNMTSDKKNSRFISISFSSDAGYLNEEEVERAQGAFASLYHLPVRSSTGTGIPKTKEYGSGLHGKEHSDMYLKNPGSHFQNNYNDYNDYYLTNVPPPPHEEENPDWQAPDYSKPVIGESLDGIYQVRGQDLKLEWKNNKGTWIYNNGGFVPSTYNANLVQNCLNNGTFTKISSIQKSAWTPGGKTKGWGDIMEKANHIRQQNGITIQRNDPQHVVGTVQSGTDPQNQGPYNTEIWRDDPNSQAITMWDCDCPWSSYSWGRTRQWKKYEGRPCAHVLALYWSSLENPPQGAATQPQQPPTPVPGGGMTLNQGLIQPLGQPPLPTVPLTGEPGLPAPIAPTPAPQPAWSEIVQPGKEEGTITFPGTFSHWKEATQEGYPWGNYKWIYDPKTDEIYGPAQHHYDVMAMMHGKGIVRDAYDYPDFVYLDQSPTIGVPLLDKGLGDSVYNWSPEIQQRAVQKATEWLQQNHKIAKGSEDTEPEGKEVGFLREPHKTLYPPLFKGMKLRPGVAAKLKNYVLDEIEKEFPNADSFIYFTVYGSGISYNWDEGGDIDLQMWIDIDKYHGDPITSDELVAAIRRIIAPINFPELKELGINTQGEKGTVLIQYYGKPGKGSKDENLASKPYACLDLETGKWLVRPSPIRPEFYGDAFLKILPEANSLANEAESLCDDFERHIKEYQYWDELDNEISHEGYKTRMMQLKSKIEDEHAGIKRFFKRVFEGRSEAYSPSGKGLEDERDFLQKLLEVWGIFQRLKKDARTPLPWDEIKESAWKEDLFLNPDLENVRSRWIYDLSSNKAYFGDSHHFEIIKRNQLGENPEMGWGSNLVEGYLNPTQITYYPEDFTDFSEVINAVDEQKENFKSKRIPWREASFNNGDIVRVWEEVQGYAQPAYGQPGYPVVIKKNQSGEVLFSDDQTTVAIFPLQTGKLEHHLVKVECPTANLYLDKTNAQPFVKKP